MQVSPKKIFKTIVLLPMWPLIWFAMYSDSCSACGDLESACKRRARKMLSWWRS